MANKVKADVVVSYPDEDGEWSTLKLSRFEAEYVRRALDLAMGNGHSTDSVRLRENPAAYAVE